MHDPMTPTPVDAALARVEGLKRPGNSEEWIAHVHNLTWNEALRAALDAIAKEGEG